MIYLGSKREVYEKRPSPPRFPLLHSCCCFYLDLHITSRLLFFYLTLTAICEIGHDPIRKQLVKLSMAFKWKWNNYYQSHCVDWGKQGHRKELEKYQGFCNSQSIRAILQLLWLSDSKTDCLLGTIFFVTWGSQEVTLLVTIYPLFDHAGPFGLVKQFKVI